MRLQDHEAERVANVRRAGDEFLSAWLEQQCRQHNSSTGGRKSYRDLMIEGERLRGRQCDRFAQGGRAGR